MLSKSFSIFTSVGETTIPRAQTSRLAASYFTPPRQTSAAPDVQRPFRPSPSRDGRTPGKKWNEQIEKKKKSQGVNLHPLLCSCSFLRWIWERTRKAHSSAGTLPPIRTVSFTPSLTKRQRGTLLQGSLRGQWGCGRLGCRDRSRRFNNLFSAANN